VNEKILIVEDNSRNMRLIEMVLGPKVSGLEVTRRLRDTPLFSHTPIIAITAYAMKGDEAKAIDCGCNAYLPKPIDTRQLPRVITEMLRQQQNNNIGINGYGEEDSYS